MMCCLDGLRLWEELLSTVCIDVESVGYDDGNDDLPNRRYFGCVDY
jgi:hypothetical protein